MSVKNIAIVMVMVMSCALPGYAEGTDQADELQQLDDLNRRAQILGKMVEIKNLERQLNATSPLNLPTNFRLPPPEGFQSGGKAAPSDLPLVESIQGIKGRFTAVLSYEDATVVVSPGDSLGEGMRVQSITGSKVVVTDAKGRSHRLRFITPDSVKNKKD